MKFLKKQLRTILFVLILFTGLGLLAYPSFANWWNTTLGSHAVANYEQIIEETNTEDLEAIRQKAAAYNTDLLTRPDRYHPTPEQSAEYNELLKVGDSSVMGSISIPSIKVNLPIYHGTSEDVLAAGAGHLEGTSLPIGGIGTHTVITGHRGLPSAKLFTDLDQLVEGDYFVLSVLNEKLTYQIDSIRIVLPAELDQLAIDPAKDQATLVTCTPYGINTHRILITGHRVENLEEWSLDTEARVIDEKIVALWIGGAIIGVLLIVLLIRTRKPRAKKGESNDSL
ncbi:class C sortase [Allobaculum mucilyticum]|uniref:class C sortase n=1 Tax=Allobaculum mucilyticum TaxID=2834459 RepID=UPI001E4CD6F2|nr:class C sortase [Allobaculum mucilyticum]UNT97275.1 class C sortase [Allobaculum mucilyticum]